MSWLRASLILQILLTAYYLAVLWFPLGSLNDQPGRRFLEVARDGHAAPVLGFTLLMLLPLLLFALAVRRRWYSLVAVGLVGYGAWAVLQIQSWWIPWIFGANERALRNQRFLARTLKIFPVSTTHPAPDAMHFILDLLIFAVVVTIAIGLWKSRREFADFFG